MFTFADVVHLFADEFTSLGAGRFSFTSVFARTFDPKVVAAIKSGSAQLHSALGSCRIGEIVHETRGWGIDTSCDRGSAHFYLEEKASKLTTFRVTHTEGMSPCAAD